MSQILVTKPGAITAADRKALRAVDIVAIEVDDPSDVRLLSPEGAELSGNDMAFAAIAAIVKVGYGHREFVSNIFTILAEGREQE
ncbi:hypothetical protein ACMT1E_04495 [Sphingomonas flavalba]|uniref:hypothetical protein n=1 Tax=Sphingomonas flavalba TaxID=2559804 RepID=UPI0039E154A2